MRTIEKVKIKGKCFYFTTNTKENEATTKWKEGEPPRNGKKYLLKFKDDTISSGRFRTGKYGEPQPGIITWRCDCCGRFAQPKAFLQIEEI